MTRPSNETVNGKLIRRLRINNGFTQNDMAAELKLNRRTVKAAENNLASIQVVNIYAGYFDIPFQRFFPPLNGIEADLGFKLEVLMRFSLDHVDVDEFSFCEYGEFDKDPGWNPREENFVAVSAREVDRVWTNPHQYLHHEAVQRIFIMGGGKLQRLFVFEHQEVESTESLLQLLRVLRRHERLGFPTRVISSIDFRIAISRIPVSCDMFVAFKDRSFFIQFPDTQKPLVLQTVNKQLVARSRKEFDQLWKGSSDVASWSTELGLKLSSKAEKTIAKEIALINDIVAFSRQSLSSSN